MLHLLLFLRPPRLRTSGNAQSVGWLERNKDFWQPRASQLIQEMMIEESEAASVARAKATDGAAHRENISDISSVSFTS